MWVGLIIVKAQPSTDIPLIADIKHYSPEDGLSNRMISSIATDNRGILWLGTSFGLNRFDGISFKSFDRKDGLAGNRIHRLFSDGDVIWCYFLHEPGYQAQNAVSLFHVTREKVVTMEEHMGNNLPFSAKDIQEIRPDNQILLIYLKDSHQNAIYKYNPKEGLHLLPDLPYSKGIALSKSNHFWSIDILKSVLIIQKADAFGKEIHHYKIPVTDPLYVEQYEEMEFIEEIDGGAYFKIKPQENYFYIDSNNQLHRQITSSITKQLELKRSVYHPEYDAYWSIHNRQGILVNTNSDTLFKGGEIIDPLASVINDNIIWQGSYHGLYQIRLKKDKFEVYFQENPPISIRGMAKIGNMLHIASEKRSLQLEISPDNKKIIKDKTWDQFGRSLSALADRQGNFWTNMFFGLVKFDVEKQDTLIYKTPESWDNWALYEDKKGRIWYGVKNLNYLNPATGERQVVETNGFEEIRNNTIYHFSERADGKVWLCATSGLYVLDIDKGIQERYWSGGTGKFYLPANDFRHFTIDKKDQSFWLAAPNVGLVYWKPSINETGVYSLNKAQANIIHAVYQDNYGYLWLSTENGIVRFHKNTHQFQSYLEKDGISNNEFNRIAHFQDEDGTIYFGSIDGLTIFHPKHFTTDTLNIEKVNIVVSELEQYLQRTHRLENKTADFYDNHQINLKSGDRFFNLYLTLSQLSLTENAIFQYKIKDLDKEWTTATNNILSVSGLPYGRQILVIRAILPNGHYAEYLEIPVVVQPPLYLRTWFLLLMAGLLAGGIYLFTHFRTKQLKAQKLILEKEVQKRTAKIQEQTEQLKALDETKSRFFANISHELRTPITLIQGPIQSVLKRSKSLDNTAFTLLLKAQQNSKKLLGLVNQILQLTKIEAQKIELQESKVVFYTFLRKIIANFQSVADAKSIHFIFQYSPPQNLQIQLDAEKMEIILNNLLSNAFKFTPKEGTISVKIEDGGKNLILEVKDTGRGIPEKDLPHVFDRFYQSSQNNKAEGGTGIGLALSKEFVKLMYGKIWVNSTITGKNKGSTFYVQFPKKEAMTMLSTEASKALKANIQGSKIANLDQIYPIANPQYTILLVEDNSDLREFIQYLLAPYYKVDTAENGAEALQLLEKNEQAKTPIQNLIISDVMMPIMDGFEFLEKVKKDQRWSSIPFIMLTARAELKDKLNALRIGVDDYLVKPFEEEELLVRIENLLSNYEERYAFAQLEQSDSNQPSAPQLNEADQKWLAKIEGIVKQEIGNSIFTIDYLAELLGISRRKLYDKFKQLTGLTPNQYVKMIRLQVAKELLENGTITSISAAAQKVGFRNTEYFSQQFKKHFGRLPSSYLH